jgi:probable phosphoglycerate mutase
MQVLLIRHGLPQRVENPDGVPADPSLSPEGCEQAEGVARWLARERFDRIYASPLKRARETALPLATALGLPIEVDPGIVEFDPDAAHYVPLEELRQENRELWLELIQGGVHAGVDLHTFRNTVSSSIERIISENPGRRVALFCHGGVINTWAAHVLALPLERTLFFDPRYTSINRFLAASSGERSIATLNETPHLPPGS